jgi:hypothetical protein
LSIFLERVLVPTTSVLIGGLKSYLKRVCLIIVVGLVFRYFNGCVVLLSLLCG